MDRGCYQSYQFHSSVPPDSISFCQCEVLLAPSPYSSLQLFYFNPPSVRKTPKALENEGRNGVEVFIQCLLVFILASGPLIQGKREVSCCVCVWVGINCRRIGFHQGTDKLARGREKAAHSVRLPERRCLCSVDAWQEASRLHFSNFSPAVWRIVVSLGLIALLPANFTRHGRGTTTRNTPSVDWKIRATLPPALIRQKAAKFRAVAIFSSTAANTVGEHGRES